LIFLNPIHCQKILKHFNMKQILITLTALIFFSIHAKSLSMSWRAGAAPEPVLGRELNRWLAESPPRSAAFRTTVGELRSTAVSPITLEGW
jgi:hypothetical protein